LKELLVSQSDIFVKYQKINSSEPRETPKKNSNVLNEQFEPRNLLSSPKFTPHKTPNVSHVQTSSFEADTQVVTMTPNRSIQVNNAASAQSRRSLPQSRQKQSTLESLEDDSPPKANFNNMHPTYKRKGSYGFKVKKVYDELDAEATLAAVRRLHESRKGENDQQPARVVSEVAPTLHDSESENIDEWSEEEGSEATTQASKGKRLKLMAADEVPVVPLHPNEVEPPRRSIVEPAAKISTRVMSAYACNSERERSASQLTLRTSGVGEPSRSTKWNAETLNAARVKFIESMKNLKHSIDAFKFLMSTFAVYGFSSKRFQRIIDKYDSNPERYQPTLGRYYLASIPELCDIVRRYITMRSEMLRGPDAVGTEPAMSIRFCKFCI